MKSIFLSLLTLLALAPLSLAADVAVLNIRIGTDKKLEKVVLEFYEADALQTVENFKKLARKGFYKGLKFHRAFPHLLVQAGDPLSRKNDRGKIGTGGPGYTLPPEIHRRHAEGAVAMSRLPDQINPARRSSGSQFYICLKPMPTLDGQYTVFAHVVEGQEVLEKISTLPVDTNDNPTELAVIKSVKIESRN